MTGAAPGAVGPVGAEALGRAAHALGPAYGERVEPALIHGPGHREVLRGAALIDGATGLVAPESAKSLF